MIRPRFETYQSGFWNRMTVAFYPGRVDELLDLCVGLIEHGGDVALLEAWREAQGYGEDVNGEWRHDLKEGKL